MIPDRTTVAVVDYGLCNLFSVRQACLHVGLQPLVTQDPRVVLDADGVILPGVGAFGEAMANLDRLGLSGALREVVVRGLPLLGVCLGLQLLFTESEEFGVHRGLGIIPGRVVRFFADPMRGVKVPHMGWNRVSPGSGGLAHWAESPLAGMRPGDFAYFVHSYYAVPDDQSHVLSTTTYGDMTFCSSVLCGSVFATQFHPEKSAAKGMGIYAAWRDALCA